MSDSIQSFLKMTLVMGVFLVASSMASADTLPAPEESVLTCSHERRA